MRWFEGGLNSSMIMNTVAMTSNLISMAANLIVNSHYRFLFFFQISDQQDTQFVIWKLSTRPLQME